MADIFNMADTWNDGATTFAAIKMNVTDTASNAASLLMDLQVGGVSMESTDKAGKKTLAGVLQLPFGVVSAPSLAIRTSNSGFYSPSTNAVSLTLAGTAQYAQFENLVRLKDTVVFGWASGDPVAQGLDLGLVRDAAGTLAQRNGTSAQTFRLYNTFTDASNYERLSIDWAANVIAIRPQAAGTGTVRVLHISGLPTANPGPGILWNNAGTPAIGT